MAATSTLITDYMGVGLHSARPATPNVPTGCTALYYETDSTNTFAWSGSAWVQINGTGGPVIVQTASNAGGSGITGATFGVAPTNGNLLIAFFLNNTSGGLGAGWTSMAVNNSIDFGAIAWKVAGAGESTTQNPCSTAGGAAVTIYEISNAAPSIPAITVAAGAASGSVNVEATRAGGLLIGAIMNEQTTALPTAVTGTTLDSSAGVGSKSTQGYHMSPAAGLQNIAWTYAASHNVYAYGIVIF